MQTKTLLVVLALLFILTIPVRQALLRASSPPPPPEAPQRIVSLAPSVTETLYALGLGPSVVGVTEFCTWPPEVKDKPRVAGFSDVNFEAVVRANPDLVVMPIDKTDNMGMLEGLGIPVLTLNTRSLQGLLQAIENIGTATGKKAEAEKIINDFREVFKMVETRAHGKKRPRVLFSIMHSYEGLGYINEINAVGRDGFYNELLEAAGGENAYTGSLAFPRLSREAIIFLNPDVIVDVIPEVEDINAVRRDWESLQNVNAIRNGRLFLLTDVADTVPGPRSLQTLIKLTKAFHPDPVQSDSVHPDPSAASPERNPQ